MEKNRHHPMCSVHKNRPCDYDCGRDYSPPSEPEFPTLGKTTSKLVHDWISAPREYGEHGGGPECRRRTDLVGQMNLRFGGKKVVDYTDDECVTLMGAIIIYHTLHDST